MTFRLRWPSRPVATAAANRASGGPGSPHHLFTELFKSMASIEMLHVPYKGTAPALNDVVAGQVPLMFGDVVASLPLVNAGKVRALGVSSATRIPSAPEIPIIAESGVPLAKTPWYWETVTRNIALLADWGEVFVSATWSCPITLSAARIRCWNGLLSACQRRR